MNAENLFRILEDNSGTRYGKKYHFADIKTEEEFRSRLPITEYEDYDNLCEPGNYTAYPISYRLETSGTTGTQKLFPLTETALNRYGSYICDRPYQYFEGSYRGPHLHTSVFRSERDGKTLLSAAYYRWLLKENKLDAARYIGGRKLMFSDDITNVAYVKVWLALSCPELVSIQSIFIYDILLILDFLEKHWRDVISDMKKGHISVELDESVKQLLLEQLPDEAVLGHMEQVLSEGFDTPIIPRLWKDIRFVSGIGGSNMDFQIQALRRYIGDVPIYYFAYASSECMMGVALNDYRPVYTFLPESCYYEFLDKDGKCVSIDELVPGCCYEPVITTFSGLYRYKTGDLIRVVSYKEELPVFEVLGRINVLNVAGEKLSETFMQLVIRKWTAVCGVKLKNYSVGVDDISIPGRYFLFVELEDESLDSNAGQVLENILSNLSADYGDVRGLGMLDPAKIFVCPKGAISESISFDKGHKKHQIFLSHNQVLKLLKVARSYAESL